ncbi:MAG TPA: hypothetical protein VHB50_12215, partial [Bryobacteraceae bacterium]|nr:hypothetical protein [Bryobacteraceae bacterium]
AGLPVDENAARDNLKTIQALETRGEENRLEHLDGGGVTDPPAYFLFALGLAQQPPDSGTDATAIYLATSQRRDGTWRVNGTSRSPIQESVIGRSALAARVIQIYSPPARKPDVEARLDRLRDWLLEAKPATNDDFAMRMLGLRWTGATPKSVSSAAQALLARQRSDGGWAQNSNLASDAYATGQSLWALHETGALKPSDKAYQRGVQFLLANQWEDGSWYVRSRAVKLQPYFQSGFPYNHDQWISSTATGYAAMALAPAAAAENRAAR